MDIRNYPNLRIEPLNDNAYDVLLTTWKLMPCEFMLVTGTALGIHRDNKLIEGDTDIDIAVIGYEGIKDDLIKALEGFELAREVEVGMPMQLCFMNDGVLLDIYIFWKNADIYYNISESGKLMIPLHLFDDKKLVKTDYGEFHFPHPIGEYLTLTYGSDWNVPLNKRPNYEVD